MTEWRNQCVCLFTRSVTDPKIGSADFLGAWEGKRTQELIALWHAVVLYLSSSVIPKLS